MKTIREFVLSKVRRSELEGVVTVSLRAPTEDDPGSSGAGSFAPAAFGAEPVKEKNSGGTEELTDARGKVRSTPELGPFEVVVGSGAGSIHFHARGLRTSDGLGLPYAEIARVEVVPASNRSEDRTRTLDIALTDGTSCVFHLPRFDAVVVHATLRWIGHTRLLRTIAD